jgi:uncharacterized protein (TIRG00374 family)
MMRLRTAWNVVKIALVPVVLVLLYVILRRIGFRSILEAMKGADPPSLVAACALSFTVFVVWCFRWQQIMPRAERHSMLRIFPIYMAGVIGNVITPGARVGGEPIRAYYMSRAFGGEKTAHLGTILADKVGTFAVFLVFMAVSVGFVIATVPLALGVRLLLGGLLGVIVLVIISGFVVRRFTSSRSSLVVRILRFLYEGAPMRALRRRFPTYEHFEDYAIRKLDNIVTPIARAAGSPKVVAKVMAISSSSYLILCLAHYALFRALAVDIGFMPVIVIVTVSTLVGDASVAPGGAGFMEATMIGLCAAFGVPQEPAAAVTLMARGIFYVISLGVGGLCLAGLAIVYGRTPREGQNAQADARVEQ